MGGGQVEGGTAYGGCLVCPTGLCSSARWIARLEQRLLQERAGRCPLKRSPLTARGGRATAAPRESLSLGAAGSGQRFSGQRQARRSATVHRRPAAVQISPRFANAEMCSAARKANAWMVIVGWPRPDVTKLLPSQMKRFRTSWVRWY